jgi:ubiquinone/menaquinone biosynthesis C-methylase UbiE
MNVTGADLGVISTSASRSEAEADASADVCNAVEAEARVERESAPEVPYYLNQHYWWAYVHPNAVRFFERPWLVNLILWGNYHKLREAGLDELGATLPGRTLQVACAYGAFTPGLAERAQKAGGKVDVVDVLDVQLENLRAKLPAGAPVRTMRMDSSNLQIPDATYDRAVLFFLLHEQPEDVRIRTLAETIRVVKPGGEIVIVDYAQPFRWSPFRYFFKPVLAVLEPFALDLWRSDLRTWLPARWRTRTTEPSRVFGGLYQIMKITR